MVHYFRSCRWFGGKARPLRGVHLLDAVPLGETTAGRLALFRADYADGPSETYLVPLQIETSLDRDQPMVTKEPALFDALADEDFRRTLFEMIAGEKEIRGEHGVLAGVCSASFRGHTSLPSRALQAEQSNSAILYADQFFLKLYRKPDAGENPDAELLRFLSERQHFENVPAFCGAIEYRAPGEAPRVLALLVAHVPNEGDAWAFTLAELDHFFARLLAHKSDAPAQLDDLLGTSFPERIRQLGTRTAQMHLALSSDREDPHFAPELFTEADFELLETSMRESTRRMTQLLSQKLAALPEKFRDEASALLGREDEILRLCSGLRHHHIVAMRTRHHGDYHLGQVLNTGRDFIIIDFEGEPARSIRERREKRSPLRDVAGMLRSFHYAAHTALARQQISSEGLEKWAELWCERVSHDFLDAYFATAGGASFIPADPVALQKLIDINVLEKAIYEVCYELNNRPDWIFIPMRGIRGILDRGAV